MPSVLKVLAVMGSVASAVVVNPPAAKPRMLNAKPTSIDASKTVGAPVAQLNTGRSNVTKRTSAMPCQCQATNPAWKPPSRTEPRCVFIDLGAADGNSFKAFLNNEYGAVANCPSGGKWEALLVEANPRFKAPLTSVAAEHPGLVTTFPATAAYMCEGETSFYLDTVTVRNNYWGSSMSSDHPDVVNSGKQKVTVPTVNLNRLLAERTIPGDYVLVKMDIEGAEFDILPCLAPSPSVTNLDALWMEQHDPSWGLAGTSPASMEQAKQMLTSRGVYMPKYFSQTMLLAKQGKISK